MRRLPGRMGGPGAFFPKAFALLIEFTRVRLGRQGKRLWGGGAWKRFTPGRRTRADFAALNHLVMAPKPELYEFAAREFLSLVSNSATCHCTLVQ